MKYLLFAAFLAVLLSITGCAQMFTAKTTVHYERHPDGTIVADYSSDKEQQGLEAHLGTSPSIKVDKSGTLESVVAATLATQLELLKMLKELAAASAAAKPVP